MNSQEIAIANWRLNFQQMADRFVAACGEADLQRARADALQKELEALKKELEALKAKLQEPQASPDGPLKAVA